MAHDMDEVVLQVHNVKCQKFGVGTLHLTRTHLFWIQSASNNGETSLLHNYEDIKVQKISPEGKSRVKLQIVLNNDNATTFEFVDVEKQLSDRNLVKETLQQLLYQAKSKSKVAENNELLTKQKLLNENNALLNLYKELVTTGILSANEFWESYAPAKLNHVESRNAQKVGISSGFLGEVMKADGCNDVKLTLTSDTIDAIFRTYPSVKQKHFEAVPHELSEKEFWTQFFQSQYFHRDRLMGGSAKDLFADCAKYDDKEMEEHLASNTPGTSTNSRGHIITELQDNTWQQEGYGARSRFELNGKPKKANPCTDLVKRFNFHSLRVLNAGTSLEDSDVTSSTAVEPPTKKAKLSFYFDEYNELSEPSTSGFGKLHLHGEAFASQQTKDTADAQTILRRTRAVETLRKALAQWDLSIVNASEIYNATEALNVLHDISPGGSLIQTNGSMNGQSYAGVFDDVRQKVYLPLTELLRHFWCCFPVTSALVEQKLRRMAEETLPKFQRERLEPFRRSLTAMKGVPPNVLEHVDAMIKVAYEKYEIYMKRKLQFAQRT